MTPSDIQETISAVREMQQTVVLQLSAWLRNQSEAALERLDDARAREAELFDVILAGPNGGYDYDPDYAREYHQHKRAAKQSQGEVSINET